MRKTARYVCDRCSAVKTIISDSERTGNNNPNFPDKVPCGYRGCEGYAMKKEETNG